MSARDWLQTLLGHLTTATDASGAQTYLVGGCIRDRLLGRPVRDVDLSSTVSPLDLARQAVAGTSGSIVLLDEDPILVRVAGPNGSHVDLSRLREGGIAVDLLRRDLTINALGLRLDGPAIRWLFASQWTPLSPPAPLIDPSGGQQDLRARRIRAASDWAFRDDPARLLRAFRFAAELGFAVDSGTLDLLRRDAALVVQPAPERVRDEFCGILAPDGVLERLHLLDELGMLTRLLPELDPLRGLAQSSPHRWDALEHSLQTVAAVEAVIVQSLGSDAPVGDVGAAANLSPKVSAWLEEILPGGHSRRLLLKLAALLHDIGKPAHRSVEPGGRIRFIGHEATGATMAAEVVRRLRFSAAERESVRRLVACHMRPLQLSQDGASGRSIYRFFRDTAAEGPGVLLLSLADHLAKSAPGSDDPDWRRHVLLVREMLAALWDSPERHVTPPRLVNGQDLVRDLGLPSGPAIGAALEAIREAQAQGEVTTRAQAMDLASRLCSTGGRRSDRAGASAGRLVESAP